LLAATVAVARRCFLHLVSL